MEAWKGGHPRCKESQAQSCKLSGMDMGNFIMVIGAVRRANLHDFPHTRRQDENPKFSWQVMSYFISIFHRTSLDFLFLECSTMWIVGVVAEVRFGRKECLSEENGVPEAPEEVCGPPPHLTGWLCVGVRGRSVVFGDELAVFMLWRGIHKILSLGSPPPSSSVDAERSGLTQMRPTRSLWPTPGRTSARFRFFNRKQSDSPITPVLHRCTARQGWSCPQTPTYSPLTLTRDAPPRGQAQGTSHRIW